MIQFDIEYQYHHYLRRVKLSEEKMSAIQVIETRRAFMAGCCQMIVLIKDLADLSDDQAEEQLQKLTDQCSGFWKIQDTNS